MGFLDPVTDTLFGKDPELETPFLGKAPEFPFFHEAAGVFKRAREVRDDPTGSQEYRTGSRAIRDVGGVALRGVLESIDQVFGSPGGPGLQSGAAGKVKAGEAQKIGQTVVAQERNLLSQMLERADRSVLSLLDILGRFRASTFASETKTAVSPGSSGVVDYAQDIANVYSTFKGAG